MWRRNSSHFSTQKSIVLLTILNSLIALSYAHSGDGPIGFHNFDTEIEDGELSTAVVGSISLNEVTGKSDFVIEEDDEDEGPVLVSSPPTVVITDGGPVESTDTPTAISASSSGIILTAVIVTLVLLSCCAWRVYLVRNKRAAKQRRSLRNHALTANLLEHDKPYRELVEIDRKSADINLNVGDKSARETELPSTFTTTVTIEDHEAISKRLSPPPTYDEYLRSSRDNIDAKEENNRLSDLGPSYR